MKFEVRSNFTIDFNDQTFTIPALEICKGEIVGVLSHGLPGDKKLTWNDDSEIILENIGGDYWQTTFQAYSGDEIS